MKMIFDLFKLRIGIVIAVTALAGVAVMPTAAGRADSAAGPGALALLGLFVAVLLSSAAAGAFNQFHEVDLDRRMRRTRGRPFATGKLTADWRWPLLIGALVLGATALAWVATNAQAATYTFLGAFVYAIVYTVWLKRRTWWNIVVGGAAGSFAVLAGASAVSPSLSPEAMVLALILFLWTPPHFWSLAIAYRDDYEAAGVPMLPVVKGDVFAARAVLAHAIVLVALSLALALLAPGPVYFVCAAVGGWLFVRRALDLLATPDRAHALRCFHASLIQLSLVLVGVMLDAGARAALEG